MTHSFRNHRFVPPPDPSPADLEDLRILYERARRFLDTCRQDPRAAREGDDPESLLEALDGALEPSATPPGPQAARPAAIHPLRSRRSA